MNEMKEYTEKMFEDIKHIDEIIKERNLIFCNSEEPNFTDVLDEQLNLNIKSK